MDVPRFGPRFNMDSHMRHMEKLKTVKMYRFVDNCRERARCMNVLYVGTEEPDEGIDRVVKQMSVWGYTHKVNDVKKDSVDMSDTDGMFQACYDADVLIVGSSKKKELTARHVLSLVRAGWFGIMPQWDVLWYGLNDYVPEGGPDMFEMGPVCTGSDFAVEAISLLHAHVRRRDDWAARQGCMRLLWGEMVGGLARLSGTVSRPGSDVVKAFKEKLTSDGMGDELDAKMLFTALEMLENGYRYGISKAWMAPDTVLRELPLLGGGPKKLRKGHRRPLNPPNDPYPIDSHSIEKWAYCMAHTTLLWMKEYGVERVWTDWHRSVVGTPPSESLLDSIRQRPEWSELETQLTRKLFGYRWQAMVTVLLDVRGINVVGVECESPTGHKCGCGCPGCAGNTCLCGCDICAGSGGYDIDVKVRMGSLDVPMQVGTFEGALNRDADVVHPISSSPYGMTGGSVDTDTVSERDTRRIREKLRQTPPGGMALVIAPMSGGMDREPNVDWWYGGVKDKCLVLLDVSNRKSEIYHSAPEPLVDAAIRVCRALGSDEPTITSIQSWPGPGECPPFCPDTVEGLKAAIRRDPDKWAADVTGALYYPEYVSAYCGSMEELEGSKVLRGLVPTIQHTVDKYRETGQSSGWETALTKSLDALNSILNESLEQVPAPELVDAARALHNMLWDLDAVKSEDEYASHSMLMIPERPHLYILDNMVRIVDRLGADTPPEILEALTTVARFGKREDGKGYRIVLGTRLGVLVSKQSKWYEENESLLFGASDGLGVDLMGAYMMNNRGWQPIMEKYPHLAREAVRNASVDRGDNRMYVFMSCVLSDIKGYGMKDSIQFLSDAGALGVAVSVCAWLVNNEAGRPDNEAKYYNACIRFWETALECVPEQAGKFGAIEFADSIKNDDWKRLMLRSCQLADGNMVRPTGVVMRATDGGFDETCARIVELVLRAQPQIASDLAVRHALSVVPEDRLKSLLDVLGWTDDSADE